MRKYIVSDLHGNGEVYDSIIAYLENISLFDDVELYINGDLIDRGLDSYRMLEDVMERVDGKGDIKVILLGGNHELMMYQELNKRKPGKTFDHWSDWMNNGGWIIEGELDSLESEEVFENNCEKIKNFLGNLKIYHKFRETFNNNKILLVHAKAPSTILENCDIQIKDDNSKVDEAVWTREEVRFNGLFSLGEVIGYNKIGLDGFLTIKGHTPVKNKIGFNYDKEQNVINIDGGCSNYAIGDFDIDHVPLLEIKQAAMHLLELSDIQ